MVNFGSDQPSVAGSGFKYGIADGWEVGLDKRVASAGSGSGVSGAGGLPAGPLVAQVKRAMTLPRLPASAALGVANVGEDSSRAGDPFPYVVLSWHRPDINGHLGHAWQRHNPTWFVGVDAPVGGGLTGRVDWVEVGGGESVTSVGAISSLLMGNWVFEGWVSLPTASGVSETVTLKVNYVVPLAVGRG